MTTDNSIKPHIPVIIDLPFTKMTDADIETRMFQNDPYITQITFSARDRPTKETPQVLIVPNGYGFYWLRASNPGWTDNVDAKKEGEFPRPLEGFDFDNAHQYIYDANRAQLVALSNKGTYVAYTPDVDVSRKGKMAYANKSEEDWHLYFYLNDRMDGFNSNTDFYFDNGGSAICTFVVFPLTL